MRKLIFFNNASFKLAEALPASSGYYPMLPDRGMQEAHLGLTEATDGKYTVATITHPSLPGVCEVVFLLGAVEIGAEIRLLSERAQEQTAALEWPTDSLVECRVTQGMLTSLGAGSSYHKGAAAVSINGGDVFADMTAQGDSVMAPYAWAIGGAPAAPARGYGEDSPMAASVEGVGYSNVVELGVAPNYDPARTYYPGDYAKDTASPFWTWAYQRGNAFPEVAVALGDSPWVRYAPENDSNIVSFQRLGPGDIWFYPTEIGFICEAYDATSSPSIAVKETDRWGDQLGDLIASKPLTGIGARQRFVLANNLTKGVNGMHFVRTAAAAGGTCRGRFYWKGLFICSNSAAGFPQAIGPTDGQPPPEN
ncbi:MAG: hypothetical protein PHU77_00090 [Simplicispira sp.]|nr:hypothetical protein [Simplicispira sp.]